MGSAVMYSYGAALTTGKRAVIAPKQDQRYSTALEP